MAPFILQGSDKVVAESFETLDASALALAFVCGWACGDVSSLASLPHLLADRLGLIAVRLEVFDSAGKAVVCHDYSRTDDMLNPEDPDAFRFAAPLNGTLTMKLTAHHDARNPLALRQMSLLRELGHLVHKAIACILLQQYDRAVLGQPFERLSEREWEVCRALEGQDKEEQIAVALQCSYSTVHSHVQRIYKKLQVKGRKELVALLAQGRQRVQLRAMQRFGRKDRGGDVAV